MFAADTPEALFPINDMKSGWTLTSMTCMDASFGLRHSALTADRIPVATAGIQSHENGLPIWIGKAGGVEVSVCRCECCVWHPTIQIQVAAIRQQQAFHASWCQTLRMM